MRPSGDSEMLCENQISKLLPWLKTAPRYTTYRVNTLATTATDFIKILQDALRQVASKHQEWSVNLPVPDIWQHPHLPELVVVESIKQSGSLAPSEIEVIVDPACGAAVLRGAHIFAPGVMGLPTGAKEGDIVSVYADLVRECKRGWTQRLDEVKRLYLGNGVLLMGRKNLFGENKAPNGVAVQMIQNVSGVPVLPPELSINGLALMQNFPSVLCGRVLNPQPGDVVLDMCAAPGNKTTHLSAQMKNEGIIIALDRSANRVSKLQRTCMEYGVTNVHAYVCDSVKALCRETSINNEEHNKFEKNSVLPTTDLLMGPPYPPDSFDRILLDAPCSGLGQRPRLETINAKQCSSFPPLQRKLFETAVGLLKPGGSLVYSTCTILEEENERLVRWAVDHFSCLKLIPAEPRFSTNSSLESSANSILLPSEKDLVQKFSPKLDSVVSSACEEDTIGFFIAHFRKTGDEA